MTKTVVQEEGAPPSKGDGYADIFAAATKARGDEPRWLQERRAAAWELFRVHGVPHPKLEGFRKTDLGELRSIPFVPPDAPGSVTEEELAPHRLEGAAAELVLVDGMVDPALSRLGKTDGITVAGLQALLADAPERLEPHLARIVAHDGPEEALRALGTALFQDGAYVHVARGAVPSGPIHVLNIATRGAAPTGIHTRVLGVFDETVEATLVETYVGLGDAHWTNAVTELVLGPSAVIDHAKIQREPLTAYHTMAATAHLARDAKLRDLSAAFGARRSRTDITARLAQGSEVQMDGLFMGRGDQLVDHHTWIDHAEPHGTSLERYKGILDGKAHGVFTGHVLVRQDAQKTNSDQQNRNLILSKKALIDTTPQLEIHADDVKCAHGSTIGQLPPQQVFYLRSRGLEEEEAKRIITEAFAAEVLDALPAGELRERLQAHVSEWFSLRKEDE